MADNDMQMIATSSIEEELRCPVCRTMPRTLPIPCCPRGHLVCRSCRGKIRDDNCPTCRLPMGDNVSTVAGALVDKIPHFCRFSDLGCEEKDILKDIVEHEKNCPVKESFDKQDEDNLEAALGETTAGDGVEGDTLVDERERLGFRRRAIMVENDQVIIKAEWENVKMKMNMSVENFNLIRREFPQWSLFNTNN